MRNTHFRLLSVAQKHGGLTPSIVKQVRPGIIEKCCRNEKLHFQMTCWLSLSPPSVLKLPTALLQSLSKATFLSHGRQPEVNNSHLAIVSTGVVGGKTTPSPAIGV